MAADIFKAVTPCPMRIPASSRARAGGVHSIFGKIILLFLGILAAVIGGMTYWNYRMMETEAVGRMQDRLKAVAVAGALRVDAAAHGRVQSAAAGPDELPAGEEHRKTFAELVGMLRELRKAVDLSTDVYTLRLAEERAAEVRSNPAIDHADALEFVVMTNGSPFFKHRLTYRPFMAPAFLEGRPVTTDLYQDDHGRWVSALAPVMGPDGGVVAVLEVDASFDEYHDKNIAVMKQLALAGATILLVGALLAFLLARSIARPIGALTVQARRLGDGDYVSPIHAASSDEVGVLAEMLDSARTRIHSFIQDILDVAPFIMVVFDRNFVAGDTASRIARERLGADVTGRHLTDLLRGKTGRVTPPSTDFLRHVTENPASPEIFSDMMKLACERLEIDGRVYAIRFLPRFDGDRVASIFMLGEDITDAERARAATRRAVMFMTLIRDYDEFMAMKTTIDDSMQRLDEIAVSPSETIDKAVLEEAFRIAHTIKGSLAMFEMDRIVAAAQDLETALQETLDGGASVSATSPLLSEGVRNLRNLYEEDLAELESVRGGGDENFLRIYNSEIKTLGDAILAGNRNGAERVLAHLDRPLLSAHVGTLARNLTRAAARKLDKDVVCEVEAEADIRLPAEWQRLLDIALPHLVRNAVDHGLEYPDEREESGKTPTGTVTVRTARDEDRFMVVVRDDGKGIDDESIRRAAESRGLIPAGETPDVQSLRRLILISGFSTREEVSEISGRGVGLDAVAGAVMDMGGAVEILSEPGQFTEFRISFPLNAVD